MTGKRKSDTIDPVYLHKQQEALVRKNRQVIYFNDREKAVMDVYCKRFKIKSKGALFREMIMEKIIESLEENHPTLF